MIFQMVDKVKEQAGEFFAFEIWSLAVQPEQTVRIGATDADVYSFISRTENGLYQCGLCLKISRDGSNMRRHMMIKHSEPTNEECHRVFPNRFYLARHSKICSVNSWFFKIFAMGLACKGSLGICLKTLQEKCVFCYWSANMVAYGSQFSCPLGMGSFQNDKYLEWQ